MMSQNLNITEDQKKQLQSWVNQKISLSDIQKNIQNQWEFSITYMDLRFLIDDLSVEIPVEQDPIPKTPTDDPNDTLTPPQEGVRVEVDKVMRPGTLVSGSVTFTDGEHAQWHLDTMGRIGLVPTKEGYQPLPQDIQDFQIQLKTELQKAGF